MGLPPMGTALPPETGPPRKVTCRAVFFWVRLGYDDPHSRSHLQGAQVKLTGKIRQVYILALKGYWVAETRHDERRMWKIINLIDGWVIK